MSKEYHFSPKKKSENSLRYYLPIESDESQNNDQNVLNFNQSLISMTDKGIFKQNFSSQRRKILSREDSRYQSIREDSFSHNVSYFIKKFFRILKLKKVKILSKVVGNEMKNLFLRFKDGQIDPIYSLMWL